ncbi:MAG TPA: hypothetical protein VKU02_14645 [Gemmataceae bacterium]|nr:hypothetical protein [Gemmataceae bacterium]
MIAPNFHQIPNTPRTPPFRFLRFLFFPSLTATALWLSGALAQQAPPSAPPSSPAAPAPKADPGAERTVRAAIELLNPKQPGWLETKLRQQVHARGLAFNADGRYVSGPDHRLHLELTVHLGSADGALQVISDGSTVWEEVHIGKGEHFVSRWNLKKVEEALNSPGSLPQIREQFYRSRAFAGVVPLLQNVRDQMTFTKQEDADWQKHKVLKLTAVWSAQVSKNLSPQGNAWPPLMPRTCQLFLGKDAPHWPYRLEWRGPTTPGAEDSLLMEMEFQSPRFTAASDPPPPDYARLFSFDPGKMKVLDRTQEISDFVTAQIRNQAKPAKVP